MVWVPLLLPNATVVLRGYVSDVALRQKEPTVNHIVNSRTYTNENASVESREVLDET